MRKANHLIAALLLAASSATEASTIIRVKCEDGNAGAEVLVNGEPKGVCPMDLSVEAGVVQLQAQKINGDYGQFFDKSLSVAEGVPQRVDVVLSAARLTAEGQHRQEVAEAEQRLKAAEAGDLHAMEIIAGYYASGRGVERNAQKAAAWRARLATATALEETQRLDALKARAAAGEAAAMLDLAARYESGIGVPRDLGQAREWRAKGEAAAQSDRVRQEQLARENRERERQRKMKSISFWREAKKAMTPWRAAGGESAAMAMISSFIFAPTTIIPAVFVDLTNMPSVSTERMKIQSEAVVRPSAWAHPDSMIARSARRNPSDSVVMR
ncbi:MAG TPA: hypothetical protein VFM34_08885 [Moraxellaceae bacterium]|nr:hypothetical protein [Moraxellaceae bacterium]